MDALRKMASQGNSEGSSGPHTPGPQSRGSHFPFPSENVNTANSKDAIEILPEKTKSDKEPDLGMVPANSIGPETMSFKSFDTLPIQNIAIAGLTGETGLGSVIPESSDKAEVGPLRQIFRALGEALTPKSIEDPEAYLERLKAAEGRNRANIQRYLEIQSLYLNS